MFFLNEMLLEIASPTTNLHMILDKSLNFLDFLPALCLSFLNYKVRRDLMNFLGSKFPNSKILDLETVTSGGT